MKLILFYVLVFFLLPSDLFAWEGQPTSIYDGDTITVLDSSGNKIRIRLFGVDCPEMNQPFGKESKKFVVSWVQGRSVELAPIATDRYGRTVARVFVGEGELSKALVKSGLAWVYPKYCTIPECDQWGELEETARTLKIGLWAEEAVPPWKWRKGKFKTKRPKPL